jgi:hypothetical protein
MRLLGAKIGCFIQKRSIPATHTGCETNSQAMS